MKNGNWCVYIGTWHFEKLFLVADRKKGEIVCHLNKCCWYFFSFSVWSQLMHKAYTKYICSSILRPLCMWLFVEKYSNTQADLIVILNGIKSAPSRQTKVTLNQVNIDRPREEEKNGKNSGITRNCMLLFSTFMGFFHFINSFIFVWTFVISDNNNSNKWILFN